MKKLFLVMLVLLPIYLIGQHSFGFEGGVNTFWTSNPAVGFYGSGIYAHTKGEHARFNIESQYLYEGSKIEWSQTPTGNEFRHKITLNPSFEFILLRRFSIISGVKGGIVFVDDRNSPFGNLDLGSSIFQERSWDIAITIGARVYFGNYFLACKYNYIVATNSRLLRATDFGFVSVRYGNRNNVQIGIGYLFDPKKALRKMK